MKSPQSILQSPERILFNIDSVLLEEPSLAYHSFVEKCPHSPGEGLTLTLTTGLHVENFKSYFYIDKDNTLILLFKMH